MKLYIITIDERWDFETTPHSPVVRLCEEDAKAALNQLKESAIEDTNANAQDSGFCLDESKSSFEIYKDGYEAGSHYVATIDCIEVPGIEKVQ